MTAVVYKTIKSLIRIDTFCSIKKENLVMLVVDDIQPNHYHIHRWYTTQPLPHTQMIYNPTITTYTDGIQPHHYYIHR